MLIFPAIDLYEGKAVRLYKGDYAQMTVYSDDPPRVAADFKACGAGQIHLVDLEGARSGSTPNFETVRAIKERSGLFCQVAAASAAWRPSSGTFPPGSTGSFWARRP